MAAGTHLAKLLLLAALSTPMAEPRAVASAAGDGAEEDSLTKHLSVYAEVLSLVGRAYVDDTDLRILVASSIEGTLDALDPFSLYVPAAEVDPYLAARTVARERSGLVVLKERGVAYVLTVVDGGPAAGAGIEPGLILEKVQGHRTRSLPLWKVLQLLGQAPGTTLEVELIDPDGGKRSVRFRLGSFDPPRVRMRSVRGVPVLRIPGFSATTAGEVDELLVHEAERLVVDLRGVAGGEPEAAYAVAERFATGLLGTLAGRFGALQRFENAAPPIWSGDLAVLVDRGTQGPAEILATVLRQSAGADLVGQRTFGHAGRMESIGLTSGALLELTGAFYTGPDLEPLAERLEPDLKVPREPPSAADRDHGQAKRDPTLERALDLLLAEGPGSPSG